MLTHQFLPRLIDSAAPPAGAGINGHVYYVNARSNPGAIWTSGGLPAGCPPTQPYTLVFLTCSATTTGVVGNGTLLTGAIPPAVAGVGNYYDVFNPNSTGPPYDFPIGFAVVDPPAYNVAIIDGPPGGPVEPIYCEIEIVARQLTNATVEYYVPFMYRWSASAEYLRQQWQARGNAYWVGGNTGTAIPLLNPANHTLAF